MSNLIKLNQDALDVNSSAASIVDNEWTLVQLPATHVEERKQAGKVVQFKLTGENNVTEVQIAGTVIPATGKNCIKYECLNRPIFIEIEIGAINIESCKVSIHDVCARFTGPHIISR